MSTPANEGKLLRPHTSEIVISVDGSRIKGSRYNNNLTAALLKNMKKKYNTNNIGFFMADTAGDWRQRLWSIAADKDMYADEFKTEAAKEYRKHKCVAVNNVFGYTEYYLVKGGRNLDTTEDEFEVAEDASQANIRNAFKKFAKSKKLNKVLMTKFGKAVA